MKVTYVGKTFIGRRLQTVAMISLIVIFAYLIINYYIWGAKQGPPKFRIPETRNKAHAGRDASWDWLEDSDDNAMTFQAVPLHLLRDDKCPACFGDDICEDIHNGDLQIEIPQTPGEATHKGVYFGRWQGKDIVLKTLDNLSFHNFQAFDQFICRNQSLPKTCDSSSAILNPRCIAMQESSFLPASLQQAWRIAHSTPAGVMFAVCASSDLIQEMSRAFDNDHDGQLNEAQVAMLYTSMVINPEAILLRFFKQLKVELPVADFIGSCGRVVIASHGGTPLSHFFSTPFLQRAELALQALEMVHLFIYGDPNWFIIFGDFKEDNFAVQADGQLTLIDLEDMGIIDKRKSQHYQFGQVEYNTPCNSACFQHFVAGMYDTGSKYHEQFCIQAPHIAGMAMYSLVCSHLLADKDTRHKVDTLIQASETHIKHPGLLHHPPTGHQDLVQELIEECIEETAAGGRMQAVEELKEWLEGILEASH